jgi:fermentation-respiration switch protein FrsA (DUF1100 family)
MQRYFFTFVMAIMPLLAGCSSLLFYPQEKHVLTPADRGVRYKTITVEGNGPQLHGWYLEPQGRYQGTILFLHGNAENISTHFSSVYWLPKFGYGVVLVDYRGYGYSMGEPTLSGVHEDAERALSWTLDNYGRRGPVYLFGQSLGGGIAIATAAQPRFSCRLNAVIAESPFASYKAIVNEKMGDFFLTWPFQWMSYIAISDYYAPRRWIKQISPVPLLLIHGDEDKVTPPEHSLRLFVEAK